MPLRVDCRSVGSPRRPSDAARRGFSLLEVLVALLILALLMAALIRGVGLQARTLASQREATLGQWVAANRIAEMRLAPGLVAVGRSDGRARMGQRDWFWRAEVSATDVPGIRRISLRVFANEHDVDPLANLDGFDSAEQP